MPKLKLVLSYLLVGIAAFALARAAYLHGRVEDLSATEYIEDFVILEVTRNGVTYVFPVQLNPENDGREVQTKVYCVSDDGTDSSLYMKEKACLAADRLIESGTTFR